MKKITNEELKDQFRKSVIKVITNSLGIIHPGLGFLGVIISESMDFGNQLTQNRLKSLFDEYSKRLEIIEKRIDFEKLSKSEKFYDLNIKCLQVAAKTSSKEKHKMISNLFFESIIPETDWEEDLENIFLDIIDSFSINHFKVLKFLISKNNEFKIESYENLCSGFIDLDDNEKIDIYQFRLYCKDIENKYLIRFSVNINEIGSYGGVFENESSEKIPSILVTSLGNKFLEILEI